MSTLKVNTIQDTTGNDALTIDSSGNVTASQGFVPSTQLSHRNLIINGAMRVAQRGTSVTGVSNSSGYYVCDRWKGEETGFQTPAFTISQETSVVPDGFGSALKYDVTTADSTLGADNSWIIQQRLEGQDIQGLKFGTSSAQSLTLSFWVYSNKTGTWIAELQNNDATRHISKAYTINSSNTWEQKTLTFSGDTVSGFDNDNAASLYVNFWLYGGTNFTSGTLATSWATTTNANRAVGQVNFADSTSNNFYITGVQLEVGSVATPFEHRSYGEELARCSRYYQRQGRDDYNHNDSAFFTATGWTSSYCYGPYYYPMGTMRTNPSMSVGRTEFATGWCNSTQTTPSAVTFPGVGTSSCELSFSGSSGWAGGDSIWWRFNTTSSTDYIEMDAEL